MKNQEEYEKLARKIFEKEISNALQNDKGNAMLSSLIERICGDYIHDKVKKYCQKYVKQEMHKYCQEISSITKNYSSSENVLHQNAKDVYGLFSTNKEQYSPFTSQSSCKNCGHQFEEEMQLPKGQTKKAGKEKGKIVELTKHKSKEAKLVKKTPFLKKIKSEEKVHFVKEDPINFLTERNCIKQKSKEEKKAQLKKTKSQKSVSNILANQYSWNDKNTPSPMIKTQEVSRDKIRKVQRHLSKISDTSSGFQLQEECRLKKIIEDNGHLGSKQIAHLIKGMQDLQDISKVVKLESNEIEMNYENFRQSPFHLPSGISRRNKKINGYYDFDEGKNILERERGESEYLVRAQYNPQIEKGKSFIEMSTKSMKNNKEKGRIFMKMLEIYGEDSRTAMFHFIEKNEHLPEQEIISKWQNQLID